MSFIVMFKDEDKILEEDLFEFIEEQYRFKSRFVMCYVTENEYKKMVNQVNNGELKERNKSLRAWEYGYERYRYLAAYYPYDDEILVANYNDSSRSGSYVLDRNGFSFHEYKTQFPNDGSISSKVGGIKIYTTTTYDEFIGHYLEHGYDVPNMGMDEIIDKIVHDPKAFYISIAKELSVKEREFLKTGINPKSCSNCTNPSCRTDTLIRPDDDVCTGWDNKELIGRRKLLTRSIKR